MEDSSSNTTLHEIEKLKQKISGYRGALLTLKMGNSFDDYLIIKRELDALKMQISRIEDFTKTFDGKQYGQSEIYEEQVKQFALQLSVLNQTVKELSEEISKISKKIKTRISEEKLGKGTMAEKDEPQEKIANSISESNDDKTLPNNHSSNVPYQPSYIQLRNLPNNVIKLQKVEEDIASVDQTELILNPNDRHYFDQSYFQPNHHQQKNIYTRLNKNTFDEASNQFKNFGENRTIPKSNIVNGDHPSSVANEPEKTNDSPSIYHENEKIDPSTFNMDKPMSESNNASFVQEQQPQPEAPPEKIIKQLESSNVESKKQKSSSIFNIFRK
ncbi:hypothetical protein LZ480_14430 [Solibacillus sp. MA9]|uniref:Uncharacterized protein n=1 Tax=Solibacillus palustris TaxID=2908203 RepID=A0ABS9UFF4_9BACL|nr:hypothetical protein [Solibacillus sp. MA9]MCH7323072.1 hypothetical protein [Solibacillus sp. MA9]